MKKLTLILFTAILYLIGCKANPTDSITNGDNGKNAGNSGNNGGVIIPPDENLGKDYSYKIIKEAHKGINSTLFISNDYSVYLVSDNFNYDIIMQDMRISNQNNPYTSYSVNYADKILSFNNRERISYKFDFNTGLYYENEEKYGTIFPVDYEVPERNIFTNSIWIACGASGTQLQHSGFVPVIDFNGHDIYFKYELIWFDCNPTNQSIYIWDVLLDPVDKCISKLVLITNVNVKRYRYYNDSSRLYDISIYWDDSHKARLYLQLNNLKLNNYPTHNRPVFEQFPATNLRLLDYASKLGNHPERTNANLHVNYGSYIISTNFPTNFYHPYKGTNSEGNYEGYFKLSGKTVWEGFKPHDEDF